MNFTQSQPVLAVQAQPAPVVNYPNDHEYTRVTEFKHLTGQEHPKTTRVYEYPQAEGDPYYPIPRPENAQLYARYHALAAKKRGVHFAGRLATYKYYNMDQVVAQALKLYAKIQGLERSKATNEYSLYLTTDWFLLLGFTQFRIGLALQRRELMNVQVIAVRQRQRGIAESKQVEDLAAVIVSASHNCTDDRPDAVHRRAWQLKCRTV